MHPTSGLNPFAQISRALVRILREEFRSDERRYIPKNILSVESHCEHPVAHQDKETKSALTGCCYSSLVMDEKAVGLHFLFHAEGLQCILLSNPRNDDTVCGQRIR